MVDHTPYVERVYTALSASIGLHPLETGTTQTRRWARARLRPPYPRGISGGSIEWFEDTGWSLSLTDHDGVEQRFRSGHDSVARVPRVVRWATLVITNFGEWDDRPGQLFLPFTDLYTDTEEFLRSAPRVTVDRKLSAYADSAQRHGGNSRTSKAESEKPESLLAVLSLTAVMHDYLVRAEVETGQFAVPGAREKWKRGTYLCLFIDERAGWEARVVAGLGLVAPVGKSGSFERKVDVSHFARLAMPVPLHLFEDLGKRQMEAFERNRGLPPATGRDILARLKKISPEAAETVRELQEQMARQEPEIQDRPIRPLERDAVGVLFEAFDIDRQHLMSWRPTKATDPFLTGLAGNLKEGRFNPQEKWQVDSDAFTMPGWESRNTEHIAWREFRNKYGNRSLLVANVDRTPGETKTGVDLIYYNPHGGNFVMLQYKTFRETKEGLYTSVDDRFLKQLKRMRKVDEDFRDTTPRNLDIRLVDTPCFVKLCAPQTRMPSTPDLVAGMYFTREHFEIIHEHAEDLDHKTGRRIRQQSIPRYLNGTDFISLLSNGWIGSRGTGTDRLYEQLDVSMAEGRSVVLGTHLDGLPLMNHSSGRWQEAF